MTPNETNLTSHSDAWVFQAKVSFAVALIAMSTAVAYLPVDPWIRAFLGLATLFTVTSSIGLSKTLRDVHESKRIVNRVGEAKLERFLAEQDPFRTASLD